MKAALVDGDTNAVLSLTHYPDKEMDIQAPSPGWAEQDPEVWWDAIVNVTRRLLEGQPQSIKDEIHGIGISYQMHGLVVVDKSHKVIRPAIIWCDGRAVDIGDQAFERIGRQRCLQNTLNSPGNFTASKLKWVKDNEPDSFSRIHKIMLPGDYIAMQMTGELTTTPSGLSEGILWDFVKNEPAKFILEDMGFSNDLIPEIKDTFSIQGELRDSIAEELGLRSGIPVGYRAGDQPNNAMSLGVLEPGQVAGTGGTSGVVYGVVDKVTYDPASRVNNFLHVNHQLENPRIGVLLCINGTGIMYRWIKDQMGPNLTYTEMEDILNKVPVGSEGLRILPFGNGAERMLENQDIGARFSNVQLNIHRKEHFFRAALEGIAYSFHFGMDIIKEMGLKLNSLVVGNDNLFQSDVFSNTLADLIQTEIKIVETTGAVGAAKALGYTLGHKTLDEAMAGLKTVKTISPGTADPHLENYEMWKTDIKKSLN